MNKVLELCWDLPVKSLGAGEAVMHQGEEGRKLAILKEGEVEVLKDGQRVATISEAGSIFGELSVILSSPHTATVNTIRPSEFFMIEDPDSFLWERAELNFEILRLLANRLEHITQYLAELKSQSETRSEAVEMIGEALAELIHQQKNSP
jgi:CRP/FNR family cyclic AMP-dependent transcriptional regulator